MAESHTKPEAQNRSEFTLEDHNKFIQNKSQKLSERVKNITGWTLLASGSIFALAGIGDFLTGGKVSEVLTQIGLSHLPEVATWTANHLAAMPTILKTGGGSSMIATGELLIKKK